MELEKHLPFLKFKKREHHCVVPPKHIEEGFGLGRWVSTQRTRKKKGALSPEFIERLDAEGFVWDELEEAWERGFAALLKYKKREGDCLVPAGHIEDGLTLGNWVVKQRRDKKAGVLREDYVSRLNAVGFVWKPPRGFAIKR
jgi:hypothetical protein